MAEHTWLSEAIIDFLRGPLYTQPLMDFVDEHSLIFEDEEENKLEYTQVYESFKLLVETLLTNILADLGVSEDALHLALAGAAQDATATFVLNTILTVDDFERFKGMMVRRNRELTEEALANLHAKAAQDARADEEDSELATGWSGAAEALQQAARLASHPSSSQQQPAQMPRPSAPRHATTDVRRLQDVAEDEALAAAIRASLAEASAQQQEVDELEQAIAASLELDKQERAAQLLQQQLRQQQQADDARAAAAAASTSAQQQGAPVKSPTSLPPLRVRGGVETAPALQLQHQVIAAPAMPPAAPTQPSETQEPPPLNSIHNGVSMSVKRGAGFRTGTASSAAGALTAGDMSAIREAAKSSSFRARTVETNQESLHQHKLQLVTQKHQAREEQLQRSLGAESADTSSSGGELEARRDALRQRLAEKFKTELSNKGSC